MARLSQSSINRQTHIPQHIQQAMSQHMQNNPMPANLQRYMSGGYVPTSAQKAISQHMQKTMPAHLKQYSGAYMEQNIVNQGMPGAGTPAPLKDRPPTPNTRRQDHSNVSASQYEARFNSNLFAPDGPGAAVQPSTPSPQTPPQPSAVVSPTVGDGGGIPPPPATPQPTGQTPPPAEPSSPYGFIMQPPPPSKKNLLPPVQSPLLRVAVVLGGLLVLVIIFAVVKSMLTTSSVPALMSIAQEQQELIHLVTTSNQQQGQQVLSTDNQNFAVTTQVSVQSDQTQLLAYMNQHGQKVKDKTLNLKIDTSLDSDLSTAAANSTYDSTFQQIMQTKLKAYQQTLTQAYDESTGPHIRALLKQDYANSQLLLVQLNSPTS